MRVVDVGFAGNIAIEDNRTTKTVSVKYRNGSWYVKALDKSFPHRAEAIKAAKEHLKGVINGKT